MKTFKDSAVLGKFTGEQTSAAQFKLAIVRSEALCNFYSAERRSGADPLTANERMSEYAKRLDGLQSEYDRDLDVIRRCMERKS